MAEILTLESFSLSNIQEQTKLGADGDAGAKTISVLNDDNIAVDDYVVVGRYGTEQAEIRLITGVASNVLTVAATEFDHKKGESLVVIKGNQIKLYRATNLTGSTPADISFSELATVDIQADQLYIDYEDTSGGSGYWYKQTYYNSTTTTETDLSYSDAVRGGQSYYCTLEDIKRTAGYIDDYDNRLFLPDSIIEARRKEAISYIDGKLTVAGYTLPVSDSQNPLLRTVCRLYAAGHILWLDYGSLQEGTNKEAKEKIVEAKAILSELIDGSLILVDEDSDAESKTASVKGYPEDDLDRFFSITDIY